jgi:hypothetical protein
MRSLFAVFNVVVAMFAAESVAASDEWLRADGTQKRLSVSAGKSTTTVRYRSVHQKHTRRPAGTAPAIFQPASAAAMAVEKPVQLKRAPGVDKVEANCTACHSLDYIPMNSTFLSAADSDAEMAKMINAFGAPIGPVDAEIIGDYLKVNYGR